MREKNLILGPEIDGAQATMPVAVLLISWIMGIAPPNLKTLGNVSFIVVGVIIASYGEVEFVLTGVLYQVGAIITEGTRLVMVQRLLSSAEYKMDPLVSLYYFAPVCAIMNGITALVLEVPSMTMKNIYDVGIFMLIANAMVAFLLNVSVVFLVSCVLTMEITHLLTRVADWKDIIAGTYALWYSQRHPSCWGVCGHLGKPSHQDTALWLCCCPRRLALLQARS